LPAKEGYLMNNDASNEPLEMSASDPYELEHKIRERAQELYEQRGREDGHELDDWLQAEEEVTGKKSLAAAA
jgi:hypothetical protein